MEIYLRLSNICELASLIYLPHKYLKIVACRMLSNVPTSVLARIFRQFPIESCYAPTVEQEKCEDYRDKIKF